VSHFANLPFASLQRTGFCTLGGHLVNLPLASLHGAAIDGAEPASKAIEAAANRTRRITLLLIRMDDLKLSGSPPSSNEYAVTIYAPNLLAESFLMCSHDAGGLPTDQDMRRRGESRLLSGDHV
jgi:hypothetical protein